MLTQFRFALALAALPLAATAHAESAKLDLAGIDTASPEGKAELARRIDAVARKACPVEVLTGTHIYDQVGRSACMNNVRQQIERQLAARAAKGNIASR